MIDPIALKVLQPVPAAEHPGIGAGGLTNNYRVRRPHVRPENYDGKMNWNRTAANQIWGKFSYMNAVVDDLTNYLGPDPNATGDGGFTRSIRRRAARPGRSPRRC